MVQLAFSTNAYTRYELPEAVERIASHGYDGVELLADVPHAWLPEFGDDELGAVQAALDETGLGVSNVNANNASAYYEDAPPSAFFDPTIITADEEDRAWRIQYTKDAIDFAEAVGSPAACLATGRPLPGTRPDEAREYLYESLAEITDYAESTGVDVGIEFEPEMLVENTEEVIEVIEEVDSDALGVNLDLGHAAVYGEDPAESVRQCAGHITGIHLEDIVGGIRGKHYHRIPGDGDLDFAAMFDAFDDVGYDGFATLELYSYPDAPDEAAQRAYEELSQYVD